MLHVVDSSLPGRMGASQVAAVHAIVDDIAPGVPQIAVLNKHDMVLARRAGHADGDAADGAAADAASERDASMDGEDDDGAGDEEEEEEEEWVELERALEIDGVALPPDVVRTSTATGEGVDELLAIVDRILLEVSRQPWPRRVTSRRARRGRDAAVGSSVRLALGSMVCCFVVEGRATLAREASLV